MNFSRYSKISVISLALLTFACNEGNDFHSSRSSAHKGRSEFKERMAQGVGSFRPLSFQQAGTLNLSGSEVARTTVDEHSGAWSWAAFDTSVGEVIKADADLSNVAKELIARYENELGFRPDEVLVPVSSLQKPYEKTKLVVFERQHKGLPIKGAFIHVFFAVQDDGSYRLSEIVNNSFGAIRSVQGSTDLLADSEVKTITGVDEFRVESKSGIIAPLLKNGRYEFAYSTEFQIKDQANGEQISLTVDNQSRAIHEAFSNHVYDAHEVHAETYQNSYVLKDIVTRPLEYLQLIVGGKELSTDQLGKVDLVGQEAEIVLHNTKNNSSVFIQGQRTPITFKTTLGKDGKTIIKSGEGHKSGLNVYAAVTETINYAAKHLSEQELSLINKGFNSFVEINDECNAFYNGSLNFFKESRSCGNTGLISDVVKHEWGHGLDDYLGPQNKNNGRSGITDGAYSEGIGDILAAYIARSPDMGKGFRLNNPNPLRLLANTAKYPPKNPEVHEAGLIIGGTFWDLHINLTNLYGADKGNDIASRLFLRHLITSNRYLDAYQAVLRVDDDDNNPMTQSPNYCNITRAFAAHNIAGSTTVGPECMDTDTSINVKIDRDLGEGKLNLLLSAGGASRIVACPGKVTECKPETKGYVDFPSADGDDVNTLKGSRRFLQAKGPLDASASGVYTFFSLNSKSTIMARRMLEFKTGAAQTPPPGMQNPALK